MNHARRVGQRGLKTALYIAAVALSAGAPVSHAQHKPSFDVISIKPSAPLGNGPISIAGVIGGDLFSMSSATLRMLLQTAFQQGASRRSTTW